MPGLVGAAVQLIGGNLLRPITHVLEVEARPVALGDAVFGLELLPLRRAGQGGELGKLGEFETRLSRELHRFAQTLERIGIETKDKAAPNGDVALVQRLAGREKALPPIPGLAEFFKIGRGKSLKANKKATAARFNRGIEQLGVARDHDRG